MERLSPESYWQVTDIDGAQFSPLEEPRRADVVVIGGGITGLTAALLLKRSGREVLVLEAGRVGAGTTGGTSAHLDTMPDQGWVELIRTCGEEGARLVGQARAAAIDQIEAWVQELQIECDFRRVPGIAYTEDPGRVDSLRDEFAAAKKVGVDVRWDVRPDLPYATAAAMEVARQGRFHSLRYLHALARAVHGQNGTIYEHTRAQVPKDGTPCRVEANGHEILAEHVIIATHSAFLGISQFDLRQAPYQSYVLTARIAQPIGDALYWDDDDPYHYLRRAASVEEHLVLIGGADHKTGQADSAQHMEELRAYVRQRFGDVQFEQQWSSEFFEPADGLPFIGRVPLHEHLYLGTGYSGTGLTYGTAAGMLIAELIQGRQPPVAEVFSPARIKPLAAAKEFVVENVNAAGRFVADRMKARSISSLEEVPVGEGQIVRYQGETFAAYRDEQNEMHLCSPVCTHAGCYVQWNRHEKTWDCPCHGGRYSPTGERLFGPPPSDLEDKGGSRKAGVTAAEKS